MHLRLNGRILLGAGCALLRSLMLALLNDKVKQMNFISTNLYQASSTIKFLLAFLEELTGLIHPSVGDILRLWRPLSHRVHHTQYPLSESSYNNENMTIDIRDSVRLTRLVEILLYPLEEYVMIPLPIGVVLTPLPELGETCFLSQCLRFPCTARARKSYSVQVALGALRAVQRVGQIVEDLMPKT